MTTVLEHLNITVRDIARTTGFLLAALPDWRVRGGGRMDWFGTPIAWQHVGSDSVYLALQDGGEGDVMDWRSRRLGPKHVGLVVPSVDAVVARLAATGYPLDHWGTPSPGRRNVYIIDPDSVQFEFVEYLTDKVARRNDYAAA
jgi:catechol 2,3-dioxygenase-like lactoylglutathione lyase family enzyme